MHLHHRDALREGGFVNVIYWPQPITARMKKSERLCSVEEFLAEKRPGVLQCLKNGVK
jgi:hypothetical protein